MCGRFGFEMPPKRARERYGLERVEDYPRARNIAPTMDIAVITMDRDGRILMPMRWGLVPFWAKDISIGARMINARSETAAQKPAFRAAFRRRRCLIPAEVFYEWQKTENGKQPFALAMQDGRAFAMAGLWELWNGGPDSHDSPDSKDQNAAPRELFSATILTCPPNELVAPIHDRMPVILPEHDWGAWLDQTADSDALQELLTPFPAGEMRAWPVSTAVNSPRNQDFPLAPDTNA